jgi:hypothetical protein
MADPANGQVSKNFEIIGSFEARLDAGTPELCN